MFKKLDHLRRMKRWESQSAKALRYARLQAWAAVATAIMTALITGAAAGIAYLQYQSAERQLLLDLARSRARYSAEVVSRGRLGRGDGDVLLTSTLQFKLTGGEFSSSRFGVMEVVRISGPGALPGIPCVARVAGYWSTAPSAVEFTIKSNVDFQRVINEGVELSNGKEVYLFSLRTEVTHEYLDVFQREGMDLIQVEGDSVRVLYGREIDRRASTPAVEVLLTDWRDLGGSGFELRVVDRRGDYRPLRSRLPLECQKLLAD